MKLGIVSLYYKSHNYGGLLQAYALSSFLRKNGYSDCEMVQITYELPPHKTNYARLFNPLFVFNVLKENAALRRVQKSTESLSALFQMRNKALEAFGEEIPHSKTVYSNQNIDSYHNEYDLLVVGSDQVWNYDWYHPIYFSGLPNTRKIAYAASLGHHSLPEEWKKVFQKELEGYSAVSVRENEAVSLLQPLTKNKVVSVLDPTLLLSKDDWDEICAPRQIQEPYLFCYYLGNGEKERLLATQVAKRKGLKLVTLPHILGAFRKEDKSFGDIQLWDVSPKQFLSLIKYADFVMTDSFHGTVFSNVYRRSFAAFERAHARGMGGRLKNLTALTNTQDRYLLTGEMQTADYICSLPDSLPQEPEMQKQLRVASEAFLLQAIETKPSRKPELANTRCTGCTACAQSCPQKCIKMAESEEGFCYPVIDETACIRCMTCESVCPVLSKESPSCGTSAGYVAYGKNKEECMLSSSGGVFPLLAKAALKNGGTVYGAAFCDDFSVAHRRIDREENLSLLRGSKYVQSNLNDVFQQVKQDLESGINVLFSGVACQIAGLKAFLKKDYPNLLTVDVLCHGVPSPKLWEHYVKTREKQFKGKTETVCFRHKKNGWENYSVLMKFDNGKVYESHFAKDPFMKLFIRNICLRKSCYHCHFNGIQRSSDITLGDCWAVKDAMPKMNRPSGVSVILTHSEKGEIALAGIKKQLCLKRGEIDTILPPDSGGRESARPRPDRDEFMKKLNSGATVSQLCKMVNTPLPRRIVKWAKNTVVDVLRFFHLYR